MSLETLEREIVNHGPVTVGVFFLTSSVVSSVATFVHYKVLGFEFTPYANLDPGVVLSLIPHGLLLAVLSIGLGWFTAYEWNQGVKKATAVRIAMLAAALAKARAGASIAGANVTKVRTRALVPGSVLARGGQRIRWLTDLIGAGLGHAQAKVRVVGARIRLWRQTRLAARTALPKRARARTTRRRFWIVVGWALLFAFVIAAPFTVVATELRRAPLLQPDYCEADWTGWTSLLYPQCIDLYIKVPGGVSRKERLYEVGRFADKSYYIVLNGNASDGSRTRKCSTNGEGEQGRDCNERLVIGRSEILYQTQKGAPPFERLGEQQDGAPEGDVAEILNAIWNDLREMDRRNSAGFVHDVGSALGITPETLRCANELDDPVLFVPFEQNKTTMTQIDGLIEQAGPKLTRSHATGTKLVLYGFASETGSPSRNFYLSEARARWVKAQVTAWLERRTTTPVRFGDGATALPVVAVGRGEAWRYRRHRTDDSSSVDDNRVVYGVLCDR